MKDEWKSAGLEWRAEESNEHSLHQALNASLQHGRSGVAGGGQGGFEHRGSHVPGAALGRATWQQSARQFGQETAGGNLLGSFVKG